MPFTLHINVVQYRLILHFDVTIGKLADSGAVLLYIHCHLCLLHYDGISPLLNFFHNIPLVFLEVTKSTEI